MGNQYKIKDMFKQLLLAAAVNAQCDVTWIDAETANYWNDYDWSVWENVNDYTSCWDAASGYIYLLDLDDDGWVTGCETADQCYANMYLWAEDVSEWAGECVSEYENEDWVGYDDADAWCAESFP